MIGAEALVRITPKVVGHPHVAHLRVHEAMNQLAVDHATAAETGAHRKIDKGVQPLGSAPALLAQGSAVDIAVETNRQAQRTMQRAHYIRMGPMGLWRRRDVAIGGRAWVRVHRAKAGDADRLQRLQLLLFTKELDCLPQGNRWLTGRETHLSPNVIWPAAHGAHELGAASLDAAKKIHGFFLLTLRVWFLILRFVHLDDVNQGKTIGQFNQTTLESNQMLHRQLDAIGRVRGKRLVKQCRLVLRQQPLKERHCAVVDHDGQLGLGNASRRWAASAAPAARHRCRP